MEEIEKELNETIGLNYGMFIDELKDINETALNPIKISLFMKRDLVIRLNRKNDYQKIKNTILKNNEVCNTQNEMNMVITLEGQKKLLESTNYYDLLRRMMECRTSTNKKIRREFNLDIFFEITEHFIKLTNRESK